MMFYSEIIIFAFVIGLFSLLFLRLFGVGRLHWLIVILVTTLFMALRHADYVGIDLIRYKNFYYYLGRISLTDALIVKNGASAFFYAIMHYMSSNGFSYQFFISLLSVIECFLVGFFFAKYSKNFVLSIFTFAGMGVYTFIFSGLRQALAMVFVMISFQFFLEKRKMSSGILFTTAFMFHPTAVVFLPVYFLSVYFTRFVAFLYAASFLFLIILRNYIGFFITTIFYGDYIGAYESSGSLGGTTLFCIASLLYFFYIVKTKNNLSKEDLVLLHGMCILTMIQSLSSYSYAFTRINLYYMLSIMPLVISHFVDENYLRARYGELSKVVAYTSCWGIMIFLMYLFSAYLNSNEFLEYKFFFEN